MGARGYARTVVVKDTDRDEYALTGTANGHFAVLLPPLGVQGRIKSVKIRLDNTDNNLTAVTAWIVEAGASTVAQLIAAGVPDDLDIAYESSAAVAMTGSDTDADIADNPASVGDGGYALRDRDHRMALQVLVAGHSSGTWTLHYRIESQVEAGT